MPTTMPRRSLSRRDCQAVPPPPHGASWRDDGDAVARMSGGIGVMNPHMYVSRDAASRQSTSLCPSATTADFYDNGASAIAASPPRPRSHVGTTSSTSPRRLTAYNAAEQARVRADVIRRMAEDLTNAERARAAAAAVASWNQTVCVRRCCTMRKLVSGFTRDFSNSTVRECHSIMKNLLSC
jgi:hypothetical protein